MKENLLDAHIIVDKKKYCNKIMEINTILIIGNLLLSAMTICQKSRCTDIEISDCIKIHRDVPKNSETEMETVNARPVNKL